MGVHIKTVETDLQWRMEPKRKLTKGARVGFPYDTGSRKNETKSHALKDFICLSN